MKSRLLFGLLFFAVASLATAEPSQLTIENAVIRALPPGQPTTAGYLLLRNTGSEAVTVTGGHSALAEKVELHETRQVDGMMRMQQIAALTVAPGESVSFAPGGKHLMLLGVRETLVPGSTATLCLSIADADDLCASFEVRKPGSEGHGHHH